METPPAYMPQKKKSNTGLIIVIVICSLGLCCLLIIGAAGLFGLNIFNKAKPMAECMMAFEDLHKAVILYADDHKGTLPEASKWQDQIKPYLSKAIGEQDKDRGPFKVIKADDIWGCSDQTPKSGIAFNDALSGKKLADIERKDTTPLLFEVENATLNAHEPYKERPESTSPSIMGEHRGWIVYPVEGDIKLGGKHRKSVRFNTSSSSND